MALARGAGSEHAPSHGQVQDAGQLRREQLLLDEHLDHPDAEELLQRPGTHPGRDVEHAVVGEQPVGHQGVDNCSRLRVRAVSLS